MRTLKLLVLGLLMTAVIGSSFSFATDPGKAEQEKMMKAWMAYMTPGKMHQYLAKFTGEWEGETKAYMAPGAPPMVSKSTCTSEMILGGRYLKTVYKGQMMGQPFEGIGIAGYDNHLKKFTSVWLDSTSTGTMMMTGDLKGKIRTETGEFYDLVKPGKVFYRSVTTLVSDTQYIMEMYMKNEGEKEMKAMEMTMHKKK